MNSVIPLQIVSTIAKYVSGRIQHNGASGKANALDFLQNYGSMSFGNQSVTKPITPTPKFLKYLTLNNMFK